MKERGMSKRFDICNIYTLLWFGGTLQSFFISNNMLALFFSVSSIMITLFCIYKLVSENLLRGALSVWVCFAFLLFVYGLFAVLSGEIVRNGNGVIINPKLFIWMIFNSICPVFAFYYFTMKGFLTAERLRFWLFAFLLISIARFYYQKTIILQMLSTTNYRFDDITNNISYQFVALLPFGFLLKDKPLWQYILLSILLFFIFIGLKRGAILIGVLMTLWQFYISRKGAQNLNYKVVSIAMFLVIIIGGFYLVQDYYANNEFFQDRVALTMDGDTSGRDKMYSIFWKHYNEKFGFIELLFGAGVNQTFNIAGNDAHNDWLELLIDFGFMGAMLYLVYWFYFLRALMRSKHNALIYSILFSCFLFTFLRTFFSMNYSDVPFQISMIMGFCFASVYIKPQKNIVVHAHRKFSY